MIDDDVRFRDFQPERLLRLTRLAMVRGEAGGTRPAVPPGILVLRDDAGRPVKALHSIEGRVDPHSLVSISNVPFPASSSRQPPVSSLQSAAEPTIVGDASELDDLGRFAASRRLRWVVDCRLSSLEEVIESASAALRPGEDLVQVGLCLARAAEAEVKAGRIRIWPDLLEGIAVPSRKALDRVFDIVLPPSTCALLYVFDGPALHAEVVVARGPRGVRSISGHDALEAGPPPRRWREKYREVLEAAETKLGPPSLGVFVELGAVRAMIGGSQPGAFTRALASKDLIIDPMPLWLAGPVGAAAVHDAVEVGRQARAQLDGVLESSRLGRLWARSGGGALAGRLAGQIRGAVGEKLRDAAPLRHVEEKLDHLRHKVDLAEVLGFDPFTVAERLAALWKEP
jgi:hypothetical protein